MASPPPTPDLDQGFNLDPADGELVSHYLRPKLSREPLPVHVARFFHEADVYAADPAELVTHFHPAPSRMGEGKAWFFFSCLKPKNRRGSRKSRSVGDDGTWHAEKRKDVFDGEGRLVGYRHNFTYKPKNGWLMTEYGVIDQEDDEPVLCKIHKSSLVCRSPSSSSSSVSAYKRKARHEHPDPPSSSSVSRRLFASPPAPAPPTPPIEEATLRFLDEILLADEPEESQGDKSIFSSDHASSAASCADTTLLGEQSGSETGLLIAEWMSLLEQDAEPVPEQSQVETILSELSCNGTTPTDLASSASERMPPFPSPPATTRLTEGDTWECLTPLEPGPASQQSEGETVVSELSCHGGDCSTPVCAERSSSWPWAHIIDEEYRRSNGATQGASSFCFFEPAALNSPAPLTPLWGF